MVKPVLPSFDRILRICKATIEYDGCLPWFWVQLLFVRALDHPNGWIRVWAAQKVFSIDTALLKMDYSVGYTLFLHLFLINFISARVTVIFTNRLALRFNASFARSIK